MRRENQHIEVRLAPRGSRQCEREFEAIRRLVSWAKGTMTARWIYNSKGEAPYYQQGDYIYSKEASADFSSPPAGGATSILAKPDYVADWVYALNGEPAFYFG